MVSLRSRMTVAAAVFCATALAAADPPRPPEREVFGGIRFMSSGNTAKKFKLAGYYEYAKRLPTVAQVRQGTTAIRPASLFG
jgi:deoxyribodipyrimidine photo-lyase